MDGVEGQKPVYTALADPVLEQTEGKALDSGYDFGEYRDWLEGHSIVSRYIREVPEKYTASFFVNTDLENNQIASF